MHPPYLAAGSATDVGGETQKSVRFRQTTAPPKSRCRLASLLLCVAQRASSGASARTGPYDGFTRLLSCDLIQSPKRHGEIGKWCVYSHAFSSLVVNLRHRNWRQSPAVVDHTFRHDCYPIPHLP